MMALLDTNVLIALLWSSHVDHGRVCRWFDGVDGFATCATVQMRFMRVSLSPAFHASHADAIAALEDLVKIPGHRFLTDETQAFDLPPVQGTKEVTDAPLVCLARSHGLKLETLDKALCAKPWGKGTVVMVPP